MEKSRLCFGACRLIQTDTGLYLGDTGFHAIEPRAFYPNIHWLAKDQTQIHSSMTKIPYYYIWRRSGTERWLACTLEQNFELNDLMESRNSIHYRQQHFLIL